jgi:hypothetical protein
MYGHGDLTLELLLFLLPASKTMGLPQKWHGLQHSTEQMGTEIREKSLGLGKEWM